MTIAAVMAALLVPGPLPPLELAPPVRIQAGGVDIVPTEGHGAPWLFDFDGDGRRDLLVGQFAEGALRIYPNVGTDREPKFEGFTLFRAGGEQAGVDYGCCVGFTPQVVDVDGDGILDIASGEYAPGGVVWFKGLGAGEYGPLRRIVETEDEMQDWATSTVYFVDWRGTGKLDMVIGAYAGVVYINENVGTRTEPKYGPRRVMEAGGEPIEVGPKSHPVAVDWDGDGVLDLLVGDDRGRVTFFRGLGGGELAAGTPVMLGDKPLQLDMRIKIHVCDWDRDGVLDLLAGTCVPYRGDDPERRYDGYVYLLRGLRDGG